MSIQMMVAGGCWYCHQVDDELTFSAEFDTFVHVGCIKETHFADPEDREAAIMWRELGSD